MLVDLKAAFGLVHRTILTEIMGRGIQEGITERMELLGEPSRVKMEREMRGSFWTARDVRQGCPLSPLLFNLLMTDVEKEMSTIRWGGVKIGEDIQRSIYWRTQMSSITGGKRGRDEEHDRETKEVSVNLERKELELL